MTKKGTDGVVTSSVCSDRNDHRRICPDDELKLVSGIVNSRKAAPQLHHFQILARVTVAPELQFIWLNEK
jgi:hypothetical protein